MTRLMITLSAVALTAGAAMAEDDASAEEAMKVSEAIAVFGCAAEEVEKESDDLFEIDDAACKNGQYDIKLDGDFVITSMTYDGAVDDDGAEVEASAQEAEMVQETLARVGCATDEVEKENDNLFEVDDAACKGGQYDIKVNGAGVLLSATYDGEIDEDEGVDPAVIDEINARLAAMQCEVDDSDIERDGDGYELDDVICAEGGQFDIKLDAELNETGRRAE